MEQKYLFIAVLKNQYISEELFVATRPTLGKWQGGTFTKPMLIIAHYLTRPKGHREPRHKVGQNQGEHISVYEP